MNGWHELMVAETHYADLDRELNEKIEHRRDMVLFPKKSVAEQFAEGVERLLHWKRDPEKRHAKN